MAGMAKVTRKTKETDIAVSMNLYGKGKSEISTGIGFFDHMLTALALHAGFDLEVRVKGDLEVDGHHTVEDTGIVLGQAFVQALGGKEGIERYGSFYIPMDETLAFCSLDISARPFLHFDADFDGKSTPEFDYALVEEFFRAFAFNAGITLHLRVIYGKNAHHMAEALFKAMAHSLKAAVVKKDGEVLSTKGALI